MNRTVLGVCNERSYFGSAWREWKKWGRWDSNGRLLEWWLFSCMGGMMIVYCREWRWVLIVCTIYLKWMCLTFHIATAALVNEQTCSNRQWRYIRGEMRKQMILVGEAWMKSEVDDISLVSIWLFAWLNRMNVTYSSTAACCSCKWTDLNRGILEYRMGVRLMMWSSFAYEVWRGMIYVRVSVNEECSSR